MGKIKVNNYSQAEKQAKAYQEANAIKDDKLVKLIPEEINEADGKNHFHVLLIRNRHDSKNKRYLVEGIVQTFGRGPSFEKISKNFKIHGYDALIVLHDPTQNAGQEGGLARHEKSKIEVDIEKDEQTKMKKRIEKRKKKALAKAEKEKGNNKTQLPAGDDKKQGAGEGTEGGEAGTQGAGPGPDAGKGSEGGNDGGSDSNPDGDKLEFKGHEVTEENVDQFITDNEIATRATTAEGKLKAVKKFIENQA